MKQPMVLAVVTLSGWGLCQLFAQEGQEVFSSAPENSFKSVEERYPTGAVMAHGQMRLLADQEWVRHGVWTNYWANGKIISWGEYQNGEKVGEWPFWLEDGKLLSVERYRSPYEELPSKVETTANANSTTNASPQTVVENIPPSTGAAQGIPAKKEVAETKEKPVEKAASVAKPALDPQLQTGRRQADNLFDRGRYAEAFTAYEDLAKQNPPDESFLAYVTFKQGFCRFKEKRTGDAASIWNRMRMNFPASVYAPQSLLLEADDPANKGKMGRFYDEIMAKFPTSSEAAAIIQKRGMEAFEKKDYATAANYWQRFVNDFPKHRQTPEIQKKLEVAQLVVGGEKDASGEVDAENILKRADALFDKTIYKEAAQLYQSIIQKYSFTKEASRASGRLAQCQQALGRDKEALDTLRRMVEKSPEGAPQALGEIIVHAANRKMEALRLQATQQLLDRYPDSFEAQQAMFIAGSQAKAHRHQTEAQKWWADLIAKYPETVFRAVVEKELAVIKDATDTDLQKTTKQLAVDSKQVLIEKGKERKTLEEEATVWEGKYRDVLLSQEERATAAYEWAQRCFALERFEKAVQVYQKVWDEFPESGRADSAAFAAAQGWFCLGQAKKGAEQCIFLVNRFPHSGFRPLVLFGLGNRCILYEANLNEAWKYYEQLMKEYPSHPLTEQARKYWAEAKKLSKEDLKAQVTNFLKKEKAAEKNAAKERS